MHVRNITETTILNANSNIIRSNYTERRQNYTKNENYNIQTASGLLANKTRSFTQA